MSFYLFFLNVKSIFIFITSRFFVVNLKGKVLVVLFDGIVCDLEAVLGIQRQKKVE